MNRSLLDSHNSVVDAIRTAILQQIPTAAVEVESKSAGHYTITVIDQIFAGKNRVESQRLVYNSIAHLMSGDGAPVHAIDSLRTLIPQPKG